MAYKGRRRSLELSPTPKVIIACEGSKTEIQYFYSIKSAEKLRTVEILPHKGTDPCTIVAQLAERKMILRREDRWEEGDSAWAVFDGDEHRSSRGKERKWHEAISRAHDLGIHLAISNPCFELWYLLHFQEQYANMTRKQAVSALKIRLRNYEKSDDVYPLIAHLTEAAHGRADEIAHRAIKNGVAPFDNPCCQGVSKLVRYLTSLAAINASSKSTLNKNGEK